MSRRSVCVLGSVSEVSRKWRGPLSPFDEGGAGARERGGEHAVPDAVAEEGPQPRQPREQHRRREDQSEHDSAADQARKAGRRLGNERRLLALADDLAQRRPPPARHRTHRSLQTQPANHQHCRVLLLHLPPERRGAAVHRLVRRPIGRRGRLTCVGQCGHEQYERGHRPQHSPRRRFRSSSNEAKKKTLTPLSPGRGGARAGAAGVRGCEGCL